MRWIDLPPFWLLAAIAVAWAWRWPDAWGGFFWSGGACLVLAAGLVLGAVLEFTRAQTTIIPRESPSALITSGIFRFSRNPIYLADLLVLLGVSVMWGSVPGLILVPVLGWLLQTRFIRGEEERLAAAFGAEFEAYRSGTRRWI